MIPFDPLDPDHDDPPPTRAQAAGALAAIVISALMVFAFVVWAAHHALASPPPDTMPAPTSTWELPPVETAPPAVTINGAASAREPAHRVSPPTTEGPAAAVTAPPFDCARYVNALDYAYLDPAPVRAAYRVAALCMSWPQDAIERWEPFIVGDVIHGESGGCWNLRGGTDLSTTPAGRPCVAIEVDGHREDSGFGQLIGVWWRGPGTPVCDQLGLCTSDAIIASPWNSLRAVLVAVTIDGKGPWCYDARARSWHPTCRTTPRYWP